MGSKFIVCGFYQLEEFSQNRGIVTISFSTSWGQNLLFVFFTNWKNLAKILVLFEKCSFFSLIWPLWTILTFESVSAIYWLCLARCVFLCEIQLELHCAPVSGLPEDNMNGSRYFWILILKSTFFYLCFKSLSLPYER